MGSTQTFVAISFNLKNGIGGVVASDDILTQFQATFSTLICLLYLQQKGLVGVLSLLGARRQAGSAGVENPLTAFSEPSPVMVDWLSALGSSVDFLSLIFSPLRLLVRSETGCFSS
jgi:hypothetical protein